MSTVKLCQILAIEKGTKTKVSKSVTDIYHTAQKEREFLGYHKSYTPLDEDDKDTIPDDSQRIQYTVESLITKFQETLHELWDVVLTKDKGNQYATADIVIDGVTLATAVPATTLVFLEKQLDDVGAFVDKLPVLNTAHQWVWDSEQGAYVSEIITRNRTKKVPKVLTLAHATDKHPAQAQVYSEDVLVGHYKEQFFASAIPRVEKQRLQNKVHEMKNAVKQARELANLQGVNREDSLRAVLGWVFK